VVTDREEYETVLTTIAILHPDMPVSEALPLAEETLRQLTAKRSGMDVIRNMEDHIRFAESQSAVMDHLPHRKINAIKELRASTGMHPDIRSRERSGLKECKDTIDELYRRRGW
jgi:ribosomal protein L7/L12